jgi:P-type Cu2+ transporter
MMAKQNNSDSKDKKKSDQAKNSHASTEHHDHGKKQSTKPAKSETDTKARKTNANSDQHAGHNHHTDHDQHAGHSHHQNHSKPGHNQSSGHDHSHHDPAAFRKLFGFSLALTIPTVIYSETVQQLLGFVPPAFPYSEFLPAVFGTVLFIFGGRVFLKGALAELRLAKPGMMSLISLALIVSFSYSAFVTSLQIFGVMWMGMDFWWELATLITIMLLGHWIEMSSIAKASGAIGALARLIPELADLVSNNEVISVPVSSLKVGDTVLVRPGSAVPADGKILEGSSAVDESMLTGESRPVDKQAGDTVVAGSINGSSAKLGKGSLTIRVSAVGESTVLAAVVRLVQSAQRSKSKTQLLADRAAGLLFYLALLASVVTAISWIAIGGFSPDFILEKVVTVLVIACPHALGLAIPLVSSITSALAASSGVIIRDRKAFEKARKIDVVLFDKTGTLTTATRQVLDIRLASSASMSSTGQILKLAAALEKNAEHSLAIAIVNRAKEEKLTFSAASNLEFLPGVGVRGEVAGVAAMAGSAALLWEFDVEISMNDLSVVEQANQAGNSVVYVVLNNQLEGYLLIGDGLRDSSASAISALKELGKKVAIVSGDATGVVSSVASSLGVDQFYGELLPEQKIELVKKLQAEGKTVAFVGDGVNDAPALAQADVGMAIGAGTDVAIESAGIILVSSDPASVARVVELSGRSNRKMIQNLWWAAGYNILAIPMAAGALFSIGLVLTPAIGAVLMSLSTLIVAANAQLLRTNH